MKRLTKKAFAEAPQFMVAIDYLAGRGKEYGWQTEPLDARNIYEAMNEAERWINDDVYMVHLCEKVERYGDWCIVYKGTLVNRRGFGWHCHDESHGEQENFCFVVDMSEYGGGFPFAQLKED